MKRWSERLSQAWVARGPLARALLPLAWLFGAVTALRRTLYRIGVRRTTRLGVPVIVVGNLVAGGAGKTPTVLAIVALLQRRGFTPGIVSRGYGRRGDGVISVEPDTPVEQSGDEPLLLRIRSGAPVVVGRDRVAAARALLHMHPGIDVIVSDDGLQHLALARDAQVLMFDERGAGNGWLLPAGPLRESMPGQLPSRSLVLYNAPAATTPLPGGLARRRLAGVVKLEDWWRGEPPSSALLQALSSTPSRCVTAAAGLARPQRFFDMLRAAGVAVTALPLPDHHDFAELPWPADTANVIVTEKDAVKLDPARFGTTTVWVATLDFAFDAAFDDALLALLPLLPRRRLPRARTNPHGDPHGSPTA